MICITIAKHNNLRMFIYLFILLLLYGKYAKGLQATGACSQNTNIVTINLQYNLAKVSESLLLGDRDICCTDKENGRYSDCHRQSDPQNDST